MQKVVFPIFPEIDLSKALVVTVAIWFFSAGFIFQELNPAKCSPRGMRYVVSARSAWPPDM